MKKIMNFLKDLFRIRLSETPEGRTIVFGYPLKIRSILFLIFAIAFTEIALLLTGFSAVNSFRSEGIYILGLLLLVFITGLILIFYLVSRFFENSENLYIFFIILISAVTFSFEKYVLHSGIFPQFSLRTTILLWIVFTGLFFSLLRKQLPAPALTLLSGILFSGILVCIPFAMNMFPLMLFSWIFIPFGIGIFPYSPVLAISAFATALYLTLKQLKVSFPIRYFRAAVGIIVTIVLVSVSYFGVFLYKWKSISDSFIEAEGNTGKGRLDEDLSKEIRAAKYLNPDHFLETYLKTEPVRGIQSFFDLLSLRNGTYDILSYPAAFFFAEYPSPERSTRENLIKILFQDDYTAFDSGWGDKGVHTTLANTSIQIFPELRAAYTETVLTIQNEDDFQKEAIFTIHVPEGSAASRLSLWIDGKEEPGRLALKSKAKTAYNQIVNVQARDPALLEWKDGSRYRLKIFPVPGHGFRTVRVGFSVPLELKAQSLIYHSPGFEG